MRSVVPGDWVPVLTGLKADGFTMIDVLTAIDRIDELEVVVALTDPTSGSQALVSTRVPAHDPRLGTVTPVFAGAAWHERETAEMLGVVFDGHPDPRPMLLHDPTERPPLRKSAVLAARVVTPWPGAADGDTGRQASRRRQQPPGVPDGWLREGT
jgi:NADH-quinone oxidoreductase subunit C